MLAVWESFLRADQFSTDLEHSRNLRSAVLPDALNSCLQGPGIIATQATIVEWQQYLSGF
jgi:hypothetical protein